MFGGWEREKTEGEMEREKKKRVERVGNSVWRKGVYYAKVPNIRRRAAKST